MPGYSESTVSSKSSSKSTTETPIRSLTSDCSEAGTSDNKSSKSSLWSSFFSSAFSVFETYNETSACGKKINRSRSNGWTTAVKKIVGIGSMRRIHERVLGPSRTGISNTTSDIWLLGVCYKISHEKPSEDVSIGNRVADFTNDYYSRILMTYRKGFDAIGDSKLTSDVGWGCMLRSSQMLIAQALVFHQLGRSWRRPLNPPWDQEYVDILQLFSDSEASEFSVHNLLHAGQAYGLSAGSWVGPYAVCRSWEYLARSRRHEANGQFQSFPMAVYVVSGDEDGERGGAPVLYIEDVSRHCLEFSKGQSDWTALLLLVPLVLGLDKVNPRYIPSLQATFTFPQSLGILGGKPGASTYIIGIQDDNAFYLDPHDVQPVVDVSRDNLNADTSSYHTNLIRHIPFEMIDPSLAIGFYCCSKDEFDNFCVLASKLADESNGAPLFTVAHSHKSSKPDSHSGMFSNSSGVQADDSLGVVLVNDGEGHVQEDEWQLL